MHALLDETHDHLIEDARDLVWGQLAEGVFDPYILKAVFMAGGGGSGKGFISNVMFGTVANMATTSMGLKSVNSDDMLAALTGNISTQLRKKIGRIGGPRGATVHGGKGLGGRRKVDLDVDLGAEYTQTLRNQVAKPLVAARKGMFIRGRLGLIIDGTAAKSGKLIDQRSHLQALGYDTYMVFVNTTLDVALERNRTRARRVPEHLVIDAHNKVQAAKGKLQQVFGARNFANVDNSKHMNDAKIVSYLTPKLHKIAVKFLQQPLKNKNGWKWLENETAGMPKSMLKKVTWIGKKRGR